MHPCLRGRKRQLIRGLSLSPFAGRNARSQACLSGSVICPEVAAQKTLKPKTDIASGIACSNRARTRAFFRGRMRLAGGARSAADLALMTRSGAMPACSARRQPLSSQSSWPGACASVSMANWQPISAASLSSRSGGSCRSGRQLISTATPVIAAGGEHRLGVELRLGPVAAACHHPAGAVPEHVHMRVRHRRQHASRHRLGRHPQLGVHARDDDVEPAEQVFALVKRAVLEDVDLDPGQDAKRGQLGVELGDQVRADVPAGPADSPFATVSRGE